MGIWEKIAIIGISIVGLTIVYAGTANAINEFRRGSFDTETALEFLLSIGLAALLVGFVGMLLVRG